MRAFAVLNYGETPAVHDLPIPDVDGGFVIRVSYAGVNPLDSRLASVSLAWPGHTAPTPSTRPLPPA